MREQYKKSMSGVRPSAQCTERIMNMTEKKRHRIGKGWLVAAIVAAVLLCAAFTANAATDGALFDGRLLHGLRLVIDGKEFLLNDYEVDVYTTTDQDGETVVRHEYALPNGAEIRADVAEEYTAFAMDADDVDSMVIVGADGAVDYAQSHPSLAADNAE